MIIIIKTLFTDVLRPKYAVEGFFMFSFHDGVREWYSVISIMHHHLYAYERANQALSLYFPAPNIIIALGT